MGKVTIWEKEGKSVLGGREDRRGISERVSGFNCWLIEINQLNEKRGT